MSGYADPELLVADWLRDLLSVKTWTDPRLPPNWAFTAPIAHIQRGASLGALPLTLDDVTLDIDVYAGDADTARDTQNAIWSAMETKLPLTTFGNGAFVRQVQTLTRPMWTPDPRVYRRTAAYRLVLHAVTS